MAGGASTLQSAHVLFMQANSGRNKSRHTLTIQQASGLGNHGAEWGPSRLPAQLRRPRLLGTREPADRSNNPLQPPQVGEGHRILFAASTESPRFTKSGNRSSPPNRRIRTRLYGGVGGAES